MKKFTFFTKLFFGINSLFAIALLLSYYAGNISPHSFWPIAFLGLALPYLFVVNILFTLGWMLAGNKRLLLSLIVLILGYQSLPKIIQFNAVGKISASAIKIMSHNVRLFDLYLWQDDRSARNEIFKVIREENSDILCLQEFYFSEDQTYEFKTLDSLLTYPGNKYVHDEYSYIKGPNKWGIATFSRYPIVGKGRVPFEDGDHNICIYTDIKTPTETIRVYNFHLASIRLESVDYKTIDDVYANSFSSYLGNEQLLINKLKGAFQRRAEQVEKIKESIVRSPYKVVLSGDMNDTPTSFAYHELSDSLTDSFIEAGRGIGQTYIGKFPSFRIDYILHDPSFTTERYETLPQKLSDHHPITAHINLGE